MVFCPLKFLWLQDFIQSSSCSSQLIISHLMFLSDVWPISTKRPSPVWALFLPIVIGLSFTVWWLLLPETHVQEKITLVDIFNPESIYQIQSVLHLCCCLRPCERRQLYECVILDPEQHPQTEEYWGHVNPIGPRACYDEAKRVAESICYSYKKQV